MAVALAACAAPSGSDGEAGEDALNGKYASAGTDLGRATHVVADPTADAAFVVYDRALERRGADGAVERLGAVDSGFESLVVSKSFCAYLTSSFVNGGGSKTHVHVLARAQSWKEILDEDLSTKKAVFHHPIAFVDDDTLAVGTGNELLVLAADGTKTTIGGDGGKFDGHEVFSIHPAGGASVYAALDDGELFSVDTKAKSVQAAPVLESKQALSITFEPTSKTWITTDFEGIKILGADGKLLRKADLVTKKGRYIAASAVLPDGKLLVSQQSESTQERSVLATYDLATLTRSEIGTFDGIVDQLGPTSKHLFFAFSPKGAAGFNSRVWYAHVRPL